MKYIILSAVFVILNSATGQTLSEKELKNHQEKITKSREKGTVELSLDTIFNSGIPYCLFIQTKETMGAKEFSVQSFDKKEHVYLKTDCVPSAADPAKKDCYWLFIFIQSGSIGEVNGAMASGLPKYIVENDLISNNALNPDSEKRFLLLYPQKLSRSTNPVVNVNVNITGTAYETVERDRSASVAVYGDRIKQDFKEIGYFTQDSQATGGDVIKTIIFYLPSGTKIATATYDISTKENVKLVTDKDGTVRTITVDPAQQTQHIVAYLIQYMYL